MTTLLVIITIFYASLTIMLRIIIIDKLENIIKKLNAPASDKADR